MLVAFITNLYALFVSGGKWYDYPGLDFFAEVVWPFRIEDKRLVHLILTPCIVDNPIKEELRSLGAAS